MNCGVGPACLASILLLAGCAAASRREAPLLGYRDATPIGFAGDVMYVDEAQQESAGGAMPLLWRARQATAGQPINILALSGGGGGVAFGAGALVGWSRTGTRPDFQIVTGVSAGALLAPLAFLGPKWDATVTETFSGATTRHLLQPRLLGALFGASVYRGQPLVDLVNGFVSDELLRAVAAESKRGRLLLVATTDLDHERTVIWDMGRIAAEGGERGRRLFRDVLVASASIPGLFPPVLIRVQEAGIEFDEMHVDGGTTVPLFITPRVAAMVPEEVRELQGATVYVVVNGQLGGQPMTTPVRAVSIVRRGVNVALESSSRAAVEAALSVSNQAGMTLRVSEIPDDYPFSGWLDTRTANVAALFNFGVRCGSQDRLWGSAAHALARNTSSAYSTLGVSPECPSSSAPPRDEARPVIAARAQGEATAVSAEALAVVSP
jgi:predicted acylesterase/phospholipase RssA